MTKRSRTILFYICLILFFLAGTSAVFYSQGYRLDFDNKKIVQTGGLYLKVLPKNVEIYLDGKLKKKTDIFFGTAYLDNLLPKKYLVEIKKEGYHSWQKNLEIKERQVAEVRHIVLFPENPNFNILVKEVKNFWFSPDGKKVILSEENPSTEGEKTWALKLYDLEKNVKSHLIEEKDIYAKGADLLELEFSSDAKRVLLTVGMKEQEKYFTLEIEKVPPILTESQKPLPPLKDIVTYEIIGQDLYYLNNSGHLFKNEEKLTEKPFPVVPETEYKLNIFQEFIFLREGKTLYILNSDSKSFEKFFEPIKGIEISPDLKKVAYFSDYEIWVFFLETKKQLFLIRFSEKISNVFWLNSDYLIFSVGDKIKISEIDDQDRINLIDLVEFQNPEIFFNQVDKKLYILSKEKFYSSEKLLP